MSFSNYPSLTVVYADSGIALQNISTDKHVHDSIQLLHRFPIHVYYCVAIKLPSLFNDVLRDKIGVLNRGVSYYVKLGLRPLNVLWDIIPVNLKFNIPTTVADTPLSVKGGKQVSPHILGQLHTVRGAPQQPRQMGHHSPVAIAEPVSSKFRAGGITRRRDHNEISSAQLMNILHACAYASCMQLYTM